LGSLGGVEIRVDASLIIVFALITFNLGAAVFPRWHPDWPRAFTWLVALAAAVLFFASVLAHEMSHALIGRLNRIPVNRITLFLFGGVAHMDTQPPSPKAEFFMAVVGPITSFIIGFGAIFIGSLIGGSTLNAAMSGPPELALDAMQNIGPISTLLLWLGPINIVLAIFNLVPGFPLDGGRVLRSILWAISGDLMKATRWASFVGQIFAWFLMAIGILQVFGGQAGQGLWLLLIGWFLNNAARTSYQQLVVHEALHDVPVDRIMRSQVDRVEPGLTIETFVREHLMTTDQHGFPVEENGRLIGLVCIEDVRKVPQIHWSTTPVGRIMTPAAELSTLPVTAHADDALEALARRDVDQIPITEGDHLLGLVRRGDLMKWLSLQRGGHAIAH
jgi:Zn-dependent protease/CBS domain-containing protein